MKTLLGLVAFMLLAVGIGKGLYAQQTPKQVKEKVVETYSRNSLTFFMGVAP